MRRIDHMPPPPGPLRPLNTHAPVGERFVANWCRQIADSVAKALRTKHVDAGYRLIMAGDLPVPYLLHTAFTVDGHLVAVTVLWDDPWRDAGFLLTVNGEPIPVDTAAPARPAALLAHAAWRAVLDVREPAPA